MFDIGWPELVVILIVAIIVIGPRDLPKVFHTIGKWVRAARRVTSDFQRHVDDMVRETELEDLRKVANQARSLNVKNQIEKAIDPTGDLQSALDVDKPSAGKPKKPVATAATPGPGVPVEAKSESEAANVEPAPKAAPKKKATPPKPASKSSPRVPSRVPKRRASASKPAEKAPAADEAS